MGYVKFDMHCHTAEGSVDAKISIDDYINILRKKGFGGMLVTDHDSYGGYELYFHRIRQRKCMNCLDTRDLLLISSSI